MNKTNTLHFTSSPEGMARQRALYRANFYATAVVFAGVCIIVLDTWLWAIALSAVTAVSMAFWLFSRNYPWRSIQEKAILSPARAEFICGSDSQQSSVATLQKIELHRATDDSLQQVTFQDRLNDAYTLWQPENTEALEQWIQEVAVPAGVTILDQKPRFNPWNPRYLFLESCIIGGTLMMLWGLVVRSF